MTEKDYCSRFSEVLNTNYAASQDDAEEIRALLCEPQQELDQLDAEIASLKLKMQELKGRRKKVGEFVDWHNSLVSPFRRLPDDVLAEIFLRCIPQDRNPTRSAIEAPILLTMINRKCREVALTTPRLWSALHVFLPSVDVTREAASRSNMKRRSEGVKAWLERSGSLLLSLSIAVGGYDENRHDSIYKPVINVLASVADRWHRIEIDTPTNFMSVLEQAVDLENLANLKVLKVNFSRQTMSPNGTDLAAFFNGAPFAPQRQEIAFKKVLSNMPKIRSLSLHNYSSNILALPIAWSNLRTLELHTRSSTKQTAEEVLNVLGSAAPSLHHCDPTTHILYISLPHLHNFKVTASAPFNQLNYMQPAGQTHLQTPDPLTRLNPFFGAILAPSLKSFTFVTSHLPSSGSFDRLPFRAMLTRPDCALENLQLALPVKASVVKECLLELGPSLKCLHFTEALWAAQHSVLIPGGQNQHNMETSVEGTCVFTDTFMEQLIVTPENPTPLCPNLNAFILDSAYALSEKCLMTFAESRYPLKTREDVDRESGPSTPSAAVLKRCWISYDRDLKDYSPVRKYGGIRDFAHYPAVQKLKKAGMNFKFSFLPTMGPSDSPWAGQAEDPRRHAHLGRRIRHSEQPHRFADDIELDDELEEEQLAEGQEEEEEGGYYMPQYALTGFAGPFVGNGGGMGGAGPGAVFDLGQLNLGAVPFNMG